MGLARIGGGVIEIAGAVGNDVYARNPYGVYIRQNTAPIQPNSPIQVTRRSQFATVVDLYQTLTQLQYLSWKNLASNLTFKNRLGQPYTPSGYQVFVSFNYNLVIVGLPTNLSAPSLENYNMKTTALITYKVSTNALTITSNSTGVLNSYGVLEATAPMTAGTSFVRNQYRIIATYPPLYYNVTNLDIKGAYLATFPGKLPLTTLKNIKFQAHSVMIKSGQATLRGNIPFRIIP